MEEKTTESTISSGVPKISKEDEKIINSFKGINPDSENLVSLVRDLRNFNQELSSLKDISNFLTEDYLYVLQNLNYRDNVRINLLLVKIYINIISNQTLYSKYLVEYTEEKLHLILEIIDECITLITKLPGFILDEEIFKFKEKTLSFIKCIYFNWKGKITNLAVTQKLEEYIDVLPEQFYSEAYNKILEEKTCLDILSSTDNEKIKNFEDKFQQISSYFEQYEIFKKFVEYNLGIINYTGVSGDNEDKKMDKIENDSEKIDFYQQYGLLLLKFFKYHYYIFLNQENEEKEENNKKIIINPDDKTRVVFLLDKIKQYKDEDNKEIKPEENVNIPENKKENKNIVELMSHKSFISSNECKEYDSLIKKEINKYLEITKKYESDSKLKSIIEQMNFFLSSLEKQSYVPLYLTNFGKITFSDNFTPSFMINVSAGKTNEFYLETKTNETTLVFIEFNLENNSKDINFEINKYELYSDEFKNIFKEEKIEKNFKLFLLCNGYSLYQIIFDNYYSWFTSKDISYRITLLKMDDKPAKEIDFEDNKEDIKENIKEVKKEEIKEEIKEEKKVEIKEEKKEEIKEDKKEVKKEEKKEEISEEDEEDDNNELTCDVNGKKITLDVNRICKQIKSLTEKKDEKCINIPILLYLNTLRIITFQNKVCSYKEFKEEDEDEEFVTKSLFEYKIKHHLSKVLKIKTSESKNKKITISIFSQNRDLSLLDDELAEKIKQESNNENINYLKKVGFIPQSEIDGYKVDLKLYDLCDQSLLYHLFINKAEKKEIKTSLFILFDNKVINASLFNNDSIVNKIKAKGKGKKTINLNNININDEKSILDLLKNVHNKFKELEVILTCINYKKEEGKKLDEIIGKIKKYCDEEIKVNVITYDESQIAYNIFNYMNLFYKD